MMDSITDESSMNAMIVLLLRQCAPKQSPVRRHEATARQSCLMNLATRAKRAHRMGVAGHKLSPANDRFTAVKVFFT